MNKENMNKEKMDKEKIDKEKIDGEIKKPDRRQLKTRKAIFDAFERLLLTKNYSAITVQEIIDEANIGRSTFYTHFETKDELLRAMCREIFEHVFGEHLVAEAGHDFSGDANSTKDRVTHLLYHLRENQGRIHGLMAGESGSLFMQYFKEYLFGNFGKLVPETENIPREFVINYYVGSFAETVLWWFGHSQYSPEQIAEYFVNLGIKNS